VQYAHLGQEMSPLATARRGRSLWLRVGLAASAALALAVLTGVLELPSVGALLADLSDALGAWAYALVPALAFFETAAFLELVVRASARASATAASTSARPSTGPDVAR
jgi:hypothetical protein